GKLVANVDVSFYQDPSLLYDAKPVTSSSAQSQQSLAAQLDQQLGLYLHAAGLQTNWGGANEKWLCGTAGWYYLLPTGALYHWSGYGITGTLIASLDVSIYQDPSLLYDATSVQVQPSLPAQLDQQLGLYLHAAGLQTNWGGVNEKWLRGTAGWYYLLPTGA